MSVTQSVTEWMRATRKECTRWAEFFSVVAGEVDPLAAMDQAKADAWRAFVMENLAAPGQQRMFALQEEALRNQIGRSMQAVVALHQRLAQAAESDESSEVSQVMLSIDASLQRLAIAMNRIRAEDVDEHASLPTLTDEGEPTTEAASPDGGARAPREARSTPPPRRRARAGSGSGPRERAGSGSGPRGRAGAGSGPRGRAGSGSGPRERAGAGSGPRGRAGSGSGSGPRERAAREAEEQITPPERPPPHLQSSAADGPRAGAGAAAGPPPRKSGSRQDPQGRTPHPAAPPPPPDAAAGDGAKEAPQRWKPSTTTEDPVIPLTQRKGGSAPKGKPGPTAPVDAAAGPGASPQTPSLAEEGDAAVAGPDARPTPTPPAKAAERATSGSDKGPSPRRRGSGKGPLRPAATDPRVALLRTYVKRLDREVLGPEEDAALEQVLAILGGALSADEQTLGRRFRYLDQQYAADDASLFSAPLLRDLQRLLKGLSERALQRLEAAAELSQGDRLLFHVSEVEISETPESLPVVQLASSPEGLRPDLLPSYLPRLRGPSAGFTFQVGSREDALLVRRVPENRLELGFIAGPTRLWLTALHVLRTGQRGALNIEPAGDDSPAYFEARLTLPASEETFKVTERFVLAETARFVDRLATS
jgi:hypothetical protein